MRRFAFIKIKLVTLGRRRNALLMLVRADSNWPFWASRLAMSAKIEGLFFSALERKAVNNTSRS
ncbi:hypothetical protein D3C72_1994220 [compost metagenome]